MLWVFGRATTRGTPRRIAGIVERSSRVVGKANPHELPPCIRWEKVSVRQPSVRLRRCARRAAQHPLIGHPLAVVFTDRAGVRLEARIADIRALRPLPHIAVELRELARDDRFRASGCRMKALALDEGSLDRHASRRDLPLRLGRQPTLRPPRKRIRLVVAHVTHGLIERHRTSARKRELRKAIAGALPIEWRFPSTVVHHREPGREPELRALVAAVIDEVEILAIRDEPRCEPEVLEKFAVRRQLVVEREALVLMSDAMHAAAERLPRRFGEHALGQLRALAIDGAKRIHPEDVLDVRDEQLLMLLLVME